MHSEVRKEGRTTTQERLESKTGGVLEVGETFIVSTPSIRTASGQKKLDLCRKKMKISTS